MNRILMLALILITGSANAGDPFSFSDSLLQALDESEEKIEALQNRFREYMGQTDDGLDRHYRSLFINAYAEHHQLGRRMLEELESWSARQPRKMACMDPLHENQELVRIQDAKVAKLSDLPLSTREDRLTAAFEATMQALGSLGTTAAPNAMGMMCLLERFEDESRTDGP